MTPNYFLRWKNWSEDIVVAAYDWAGQGFVCDPSRKGIFTIDFGPPMVFRLKGTPVLRIQPNGAVEAPSLANRYANVSPRIDFTREAGGLPDILASLTLEDGGRLYIRKTTETSVLPAGQDQIVLYGKVALGVAGLFAASVTETSLT